MPYAVCTHLTKVMETNFSGVPNGSNKRPSSNTIVQALNLSSQVVIFDDKDAALAFADELSKSKNDTSHAYYINYPLVLKVTLKNPERYENWSANSFVDYQSGNPYDLEQTIKVTSPDNIASIAKSTYKHGAWDQACVSKDSFEGTIPATLPSPRFLSFDQFTTKANQIIQRFPDSSFTKEKKLVFTDFSNFYLANCKSPNCRTRSELLELWIANYKLNNHDINPFTILNKQRRTGLLSIFNPSTTGSQALFNQFLVGEHPSTHLKTLMREGSTSIFSLIPSPF